MALTATITKYLVTKSSGSDDFEVSINVEIKDESEEVIFEKQYSERYNSNTAVGTIKSRFQAQIVADWDIYQSEQNIFDAAAFDTVVGELQSAANTYINQ